MKHIGILVGSLREGSYSKLVAQTMAKQLEDRYQITFLSIGSLPLYNEDLETGDDLVPKTWVAFREEVAKMDAILIVSPEYNRSVPAALKNALDVGSRPAGKGVWGGKPGAVVTVSPGSLGGFGANHHIRQALTFLDIYTMQQPEAYISHIVQSIQPDGSLNENTSAYLSKISDAFDAWIQTFDK